MAIKAIINNTEKEIEQIKNSDEQDIDYVYSRIGDTEVEGELPISIKSIGGNLADYRICGNTVGGESVGDLVESGEHVGEYKVDVTVEGKNLWDGELTDAYHLDVTTGLPVSYDHRFATSQPITINQGEYCLTYNSTTDLRFMYSVFNDDTLIRRVAMMNYRYLQSGDAIDTTGGNKIYFAFYNNDQSHATTEMISNIMLNEGSTALPYEPYHAPVTTPLYLPEPIKMVGDEAEYIDYGEQKMHRIGADDIDVTLPALSTIKGTNTLSVNTSIQPSNIYIKDSFDYKKVFTATRAIEDELPLNYKNIEDNDSALSNYRIYGNTETLTRSYSGSAPLSFPIEDGGVSTYRIYGNTVNGESVGDRTENILNELPQNRTNKGITFTNYDNKYIRITGISSDVYAQTDASVIYLEAGTYSIRFFAKNSEFNTNIFALLRHLDNTNIITINVNGGTFTLNNGETIRFIIGVIQNNVEINTDVYYMVIKQSQIPDEYEPYGYRIPITNNSETANIYLDEPLAKSGNNADYIDYATQKRHNSDGTSEDVTLPALPAQSSTNSLSVGTAVQPSSVAADVDEVVSCGDRAENLFDGEIRISEAIYNVDGSYNSYPMYCISNYISVKPSTQYTFTFFHNKIEYRTTYSIAEYDAAYQPITPLTLRWINDIGGYAFTFTTKENTKYICLNWKKEIDENLMFDEGYGKYKIPVTLTADSAETTDIYLDEPLAKSGNNADYIDYATQKRHNSDGTESSVTLPEISTLAGTNTLSVGTEVQPSKVYIKGKIKEVN